MATNEKLTLFTVDHTSQLVKGRQINSPQVVAVELGDTTLRQDPLPTMAGLGPIRTELSGAKAERVCTLFQKLFASGHERGVDYDSFSVFNFMLGASNSLNRSQSLYAAGEALGPSNLSLKPGEGYIAWGTQGNILLGMLAVSEGRALGVTKAGGPLCCLDIYTIALALPGTIRPIHGVES